MRVVPNLNEVYFCPNCDNPELYVVKDVMGMTEYKYCPRCHEEIREGNITIDNSMISIPDEIEKGPTIETYNEETARRAQEEKDKFLFNLREEIYHLRYHIPDTHSMMLVNNLTDIFNLIADYIEEH